MSDLYTDRLSDYLDDELGEAERLEMEAHLRTCAECASALEDLRLVVARASRLPDEDRIVPAPDLWPAIEARLTPRSRVLPFSRPASAERRGRAFSWVQLAAACLVTAVLSGTAVWFAGSAGPESRGSGELIPTSKTSDAMLSPAGASSEAGSAAVEELRSVLASGREDLDPETVRTLEESLMIIEIAIREARRALDADPRNPYVRAHLDDTMRRKAELLNRATMLASAPR